MLRFHHGLPSDCTLLAKMISVADDLIPLAIIVDVFCVAGWDGFELFGLLAVTCAILLLTLIVGTYFLDR